MRTERKITVYVQAAYKNGTKAQLLIIHDGPGKINQVANALDNLTISKDKNRRLPAFIATLGTLGFFRGVAKWISGSRAISAPSHGLETLATPRPPYAWMIVAPGVWILLGLAAATAFLLHRTVFCRHLLAVGGNEAAAKRCGIAVGRVRLFSYLVAGTFAGIAGLLQFARLQSGDPTVAIGLELDVIAAVVIGGASLSGGSASVLGTLAGAVMIAYLRNRCAVLGWPNHVQEIIVGHIVILAVAVDLWRRRRHA